MPAEEDEKEKASREEKLFVPRTGSFLVFLNLPLSYFNLIINKLR